MAGPGAGRPSAKTVLVHATGGLALHPHVPATSSVWVKNGPEGCARLPREAGANDLGGTL